MSIADKLITVAENVDKVYEAGKKAEYDAFWNGMRANFDTSGFSYGFCGRGWDDTTFNPPFDIKSPSKVAASYMFCNAGITELTNILTAQKNNEEDTRKILDVSGAATLANMFAYCGNLKSVPEITIGQNCSSINQMFYNCKQLERIDKLTFYDGFSSKVISVFANCGNLTDITIGGAIACNNLDFSPCTKLSADSLKSIIEALSTTSTGLTITLPSTAESNYDAVYGGGAWSALIATKSNWSIVT